MTGMQTEETPTLKKITDMVRKLMRDGFFGEVGITFQNGKPHTIKVNRTYKMEDL